jgi:tRNA A22 N-methylase
MKRIKQLDSRLLACAEFISGLGITADIGTDHAYLPAYLAGNGICPHVIAADIADGPLEAAARTVRIYGLHDKITLVKSDGLKNIPLDGVSDIVIAGVGGETAAEILSDLDVPVNLVLQPMTKAEFLRMWLAEHQYNILEEKYVISGRRQFVVMRAAKEENNGFFCS